MGKPREKISARRNNLGTSSRVLIHQRKAGRFSARRRRGVRQCSDVSKKWSKPPTRLIICAAKKAVTLLRGISQTTLMQSVGTERPCTTRQLSLSIPKRSQGSLDGLHVFGLLFGFGVLRLFV
jgi:hypothetical protein